jgi:hypothetical protein
VGVGFGPVAERFVSRLPAGLNVVAADLDGAVLGLEAAIERRRNGELLYTAPLVDDPRALVAQRLSGKWIQQRSGIDDRYKAFDALALDRLAEAGVAVDESDLIVTDEPRRRVLRDFAIVSDALLVRSSRDVERISRVLGRRRPSVISAPGRDPSVPAVSNPRREAVVVWAPYLDADRLGVIAMALEYMKCRVIYVCESGRLQNVRGEFVHRQDAAAALEAASCVIDASIGDPACAIALAELGLPVGAAATSGASEFLDGVLEYEPWDWRSILAVAAAAPGARPPTLKRDPLRESDLEETLTRTAPSMDHARPLVSVIVLTYNRRDLLPIALDSLARQTYPEIEAVLINNGGEDVSDIAARYGFVRLINLETNILPNSAVAVGIHNMRGKYFALLSDDDQYYPDHLAHAVYALERSEAHIAHTNTVTRYVSLESGSREAIAYRVRHDRPSDRLQLLVGATMTSISMLFRRDIIDEIGEFAPDIACADLEYQMRAAEKFDFIHVDTATCQWDYRVDGNTYTHGDVMFEGLKLIYERYVSGGSTIVEQRRQNELKRFDARNAGTTLWPPDLLLPPRRP